MEPARWQQLLQMADSLATAHNLETAEREALVESLVHMGYGFKPGQRLQTAFAELSDEEQAELNAFMNDYRREQTSWLDEGRDALNELSDAEWQAIVEDGGAEDA